MTGSRNMDVDEPEEVNEDAEAAYRNMTCQVKAPESCIEDEEFDYGENVFNNATIGSSYLSFSL